MEQEMDEQELQVNEQLLKNVIKRIEREVEEGSWDQDHWAQLYQHPTEMDGPKLREGNYVYLVVRDENANQCGTSFCMAGHTVLEAGDAILFEDYYSNLCVTPDGKKHTINTRAAQLLGLPVDTEIFDTGWHDLDEYKEMVTRV